MSSLCLRRGWKYSVILNKVVYVHHSRVLETEGHRVSRVTVNFLVIGPVFPPVGGNYTLQRSKSGKIWSDGKVM